VNLLIAAMLLLAGPALAWAADCSHEQTQTEINRCTDQEFRKADAALNRIYAQLKARTTDPDAQNRLVAAEKAWIAFRDRECEFETEDSIGGSIHPMEMAICYQEKTVARTAELKRQLDCPEGDPTCTR